MRISDWSSDVCSSDLIREKAAEKVYSDIGRLKREDGSTPTIAVAGCVAQAEDAEIARRAPSVDIVVGPPAYHRLPDLIARAERGAKATDPAMPRPRKVGALPKRAGHRQSGAEGKRVPGSLGPGGS